MSSHQREMKVTGHRLQNEEVGRGSLQPMVNLAAQTTLPSDQELVAATLRDPKAYAVLVRRYELVLKRYVTRLLGYKSQYVDDVLQETFLKAYVNLNDYDQTRAFSPWIYRLAHNQAMSQLRRNRAGPRLISGADGQRILENVADGSDVQEKLDVARREEKLIAAVASLDPRYRDVIVLRFLEEHSYEDIADILHLPMGTVATLVSRGKERLRKALDDLRPKP